LGRGKAYEKDSSKEKEKSRRKECRVAILLSLSSRSNGFWEAAKLQEGNQSQERQGKGSERKTSHLFVSERVQK